MSKLLVVLLVLPVAVRSYATTRIAFAPRTSSSALNAIGIFYGTSTGSTQEAAEIIAAQFDNGEAVGPIDIDEVKEKLATEFAKYDALIVGTPTWNTGADTERSGVGWDEVYYGEMQDLALENKKVAVFGLGDSVSYTDNYADATGELHDVFQRLGCNMMGYTSQEGYEHKSSKAIRGDQFCGLLLDAVNQEELTEGRVKAWIAQLKEEGLLESSSSNTVAAPVAVPTAVAVAVAATVPASVAPSTVPMPAVVNGAGPSADDLVAKLQAENAALRKLLEDNSKLLDESIHDGFVAHLNSKTGRTMWVSPDGRSCYYTDAKSTVVAP